jgi:phage baseplate assembly protein W
MSAPIATLATPRLPQVPRGWPLLPVPDAEGRLAWPDGPASVRQTIEAILRTTPGEQLMRPAFGAGLAAQLHAPNDVATRAQMHDAVRAALKRYEPRIVVDRVDVEPGSDAREVLVTIAYRLVLTSEARRLQARVPVGAA